MNNAYELICSLNNPDLSRRAAKLLPKSKRREKLVEIFKTQIKEGNVDVALKSAKSLPLSVCVEELNVIFEKMLSTGNLSGASRVAGLLKRKLSEKEKLIIFGSQIKRGLLREAEKMLGVLSDSRNDKYRQMILQKYAETGNIDGAIDMNRRLDPEMPRHQNGLDAEIEFKFFKVLMQKKRYKRAIEAYWSSHIRGKDRLEVVKILLAHGLIDEALEISEDESPEENLLILKVQMSKKDYRQAGKTAMRLPKSKCIEILTKILEIQIKRREQEAAEETARLILKAERS